MSGRKGRARGAGVELPAGTVGLGRRVEAEPQAHVATGDRRVHARPTVPLAAARGDIPSAAIDATRVSIARIRRFSVETRGVLTEGLWFESNPGADSCR